MGILYPINPHYYSYDGAEIRYTDINDWLVELSYSEYGENPCRKDKLSVIELE